jgi:hypothetical protein
MPSKSIGRTPIILAVTIGTAEFRHWMHIVGQLPENYCENRFSPSICCHMPMVQKIKNSVDLVEISTPMTSSPVFSDTAFHSLCESRPGASTRTH